MYGSRRFLSLILILAIAVLSDIRASAAQQLFGVWQGFMATPWGQQMAMEVVFFPNGNYTNAAHMGNLATRHWGDYQFGENWIHFNLHGWAPREYCAGTHCVRLAWPNSETWQLTYFDGRVLRTRNGELRRVR